MQNKILTYKIEKDGSEYHAFVPELKGCHTHGKTIQEAIQNLKEAVSLYIEVEMEEEFAEQLLELA